MPASNPVVAIIRISITALAILALSHLAITPSVAAGPPNPSAQWPMFGQNFANTASNPNETTISPENVATLGPKWTFTTGGDVSARPAVVGQALYFPDWAGNVYKLNTNSGDLNWSHQLSDYGLPAGTVSRTSPAVSGSTVYIGTQQGAYLLAIDARSGNLKWKTQLDRHPLAIDTGSPVVYNNVVFVGVASTEEGAAANPNYPCCSFRGSAVALDASTGKVLWKTYTVPPGYSGGAVWASTLVVDPARNSVYVTTGNNYSTPTDPAFQTCITNGGTEASCLSPDDHIDSVMALNLTTGQIKWANRLSNGDDWNVACISSTTQNCPSPAGPDFDFGSGVNMFTVQTPSGSRTILGAGQKSGVYSAFDPDTGRLLWATQVGPGSVVGGIEWGSATDGQRIYVAIGNLNHRSYTLQPSGQTATAGSWSALDPASGKILWQTADPHGAIDIGPMTVANRVVYAPSMAGGASDTNMFGLNAATGSILWQFAAGGSVNAGAAVVNGVVFWGSGYSHLGLGTANHKFFAFSLGGK